MTNGRDLLDLFHQYCQDRQAQVAVDGRTQKLLRVDQFHFQDRSLTGIVKTGEFGYEAEIYNVQADNVAYQRTTDDAEMMPFYFLTNLPIRRTVGVLMFQRRSQYGITTAFQQDFAPYFERVCPNDRIVLSPLVPEQMINNYIENGQLTKVRFIRHAVPQDIADAYDAGGHVQEEDHVELVILPGRGRRIPLLGRLAEVIQGDRNVNNLIELEDFDYDNVKVELEVAGSHRTLDLSDVMRLKAHYDITGDLEIGQDGHPVFASIDQIARGLMNGLLDNLGG